MRVLLESSCMLDCWMLCCLLSQAVSAVRWSVEQCTARWIVEWCAEGCPRLSLLSAGAWNGVLPTVCWRRSKAVSAVCRSPRWSVKQCTPGLLEQCTPSLSLLSAGVFAGVWNSVLQGCLCCLLECGTVYCARVCWTGRFQCWRVHDSNQGLTPAPSILGYALMGHECLSCAVFLTVLLPREVGIRAVVWKFAELEDCNAVHDSNQGLTPAPSMLGYAFMGHECLSWVPPPVVVRESRC